MDGILDILGGIIGNTNGIAPGLELDFQFFGFEFSSQSEYIFDFHDKENWFFYNWTDLTYSPIEWLWFGLSFQRTRLYKTNLDFQYGLVAGGGYKWFGLTGYAYNLGLTDPYFICALTFTFPEP